MARKSQIDGLRNEEEDNVEEELDRCVHRMRRNHNNGIYGLRVITEFTGLGK